LNVAHGTQTHAGGWFFEFTQQYEKIEGEHWHSVVLDGVESGAHVSDQGRFRSTRGVIHGGSLRIDGHRNAVVGGKGYLLHRLVCTVWHVPPTPEHSLVCHKDWDASNNLPANLHWATPSESTQYSFANNLNRKSNAAARSKPVRGRKQGTVDDWRHFESCSAAARELGPGFHGSSVWGVANGKCTHTRGWTFEFTQQHEDLAGEVWKDAVLLPPNVSR